MNLIRQLKKQTNKEAKPSGFALPTVLILSVILLAIGTSTLQLAAAISRALVDQHWNRLAKVTAQSGISFASDCANKGTWSSPLTPNMSCQAVVDPARDNYVSSDTTNTASPSRWRSTYTIGVPVTGSDGNTRSTITGKVEVLTPTTPSSVAKTYSWEYIAIISTPNSFLEFNTNSFSTCLFATDQQVYCTGYNNYGQLGNPGAGYINSSAPIKFQLPAGKKAVKIEQYSYFGTTACVLTTDQLVYCAGNNNYGQLGNASAGVRSSTPLQFQLPAGKLATNILLSSNNTCALTTDQLVYCSGWNQYGQLGNTVAGFTNSSTPVQFQLPAGKLAAAVGTVDGSSTCVLTTDQEVYCAGYSATGQLGNPAAVTNTFVPVQFQLPAGKKVAEIDNTSAGSACVLTTDQQVYCAGSNTNGQLGNPTAGYVNSSTPVQFQLPAGKRAVAVDNFSSATCVHTTDRLVYCAGFNSNGQLGNPIAGSTSTPVQFQLPGGKLAVLVGRGASHTCALTNDQEVYCAGSNVSGQLGNASVGAGNSSTPVQFQLPAGDTAVMLSVSNADTCVLTSTQQIYCAGNNDYGQLGRIPLQNQFTPVRMPQP